MNKFEEALALLHNLKIGFKKKDVTDSDIACVVKHAYPTIHKALTQAAEIERGDKVVVNGWRPIESAPKDGTEYLCTDGKYIEIGLYDYGYEIRNNGDYMAGGYGSNYETGKGNLYAAPTRWMPLPHPPMIAAASEASDEN